MVAIAAISWRPWVRPWGLAFTTSSRRALWKAAGTDSRKARGYGPRGVPLSALEDLRRRSRRLVELAGQRLRRRGTPEAVHGRLREMEKKLGMKIVADDTPVADARPTPSSWPKRLEGRAARRPAAGHVLQPQPAAGRSAAGGGREAGDSRRLLHRAGRQARIGRASTAGRASTSSSRWTTSRRSSTACG